MVPAVVPGISLTRRDDGPRAAVVAVLVDAKFPAEVPEERAEVVPWPRVVTPLALLDGMLVDLNASLLELKLWRK